MAELDRHCKENANRAVGQNAAGSRESKVWGPIYDSGRNTLFSLGTAVINAFTIPYFHVYNCGHYRFPLGPRPDHLGGGRIPDQKDLRQYEVFEERLERSPLAVAHQYRRQVEAMGCRSIREFGRRTGEDWSVVARHLRLLQLPGDIITFLEQNQTPTVLRHFTVKRLDELARMPAHQATASFTQELCMLGVPVSLNSTTHADAAALWPTVEVAAVSPGTAACASICL